MESSGAGSPQQQTRLACQACQRRKIKCDRLSPCCGQCQRSNLSCTQSTRKARTRHVKRAGDSELRNRIAKLESLVDSLGGDAGLPQDAATRREDEEASVNTASIVPSALGKYIGADFWQSLTGEVQSLRDALEDEESDVETDGTPPGLPTAPNGNSTAPTHDLIVCPPNSIFVMPGALQEPSPQMARELHEIYHRNVDTVFKATHRPTIKAFLEGGSYLGLPHEAPANRVLQAAIWFAAVSAIQDQECVARFGIPKSELQSQFRRRVDVALSQADFINTIDLATVTGAVIYVASSRMSDLSRRAWTLTGLIIRIAYGIGLHREIPTHTPYTKEVRRRIWHTILVLDTFASVDRGTQPLCDTDSTVTPCPTLCNDEDFDENSTSIPTRTGICDMTFTLMCHSAASLTMRLSLSETSPTGETWQQRLELAQNLSKNFHQNYFRYCDPADPFHRFLHAVGRTMISSTILRAVRPLQRHVSSIPPRVDSSFVLQIAVNAMRDSEAVKDDPETEGWRWMVWVQWHALAVSLAGLCSIRDTELAGQAWELVEKAYELNGGHVADTRSGMLWRPIEKLYRKASAFRDGGEQAKGRITATTTAGVSNGNGVVKTSPPVAVSQAQVPSPPLPDMSMPLQGGYQGFSPLQGGDLSWMDWERIMEDMSGSVDPLVGGVQGMDMGLSVMSNVGMGGNGLGMESGINGVAKVDGTGYGGVNGYGNFNANMNGHGNGGYGWTYPNSNGPL
ncbi:hypothetical protein TI39_contig4169g00017 [Zymoseptoria brevis]|uniref:Zn(2)-C6 fungal-type domain-containing protein n=1 Tax=Zymoseptoria brevis TaxID=1047168 RepID=A0A0F4GB90_9PEZI|nr:hypothetical protein TI39_contig4169g00017 [Zymoseptoria brevis]